MFGKLLGYSLLASTILQNLKPQFSPYIYKIGFIVSFTLSFESSVVFPFKSEMLAQLC